MGSPWDAWLLAERALPPRTPADAGAERRLVDYSEAATRHPGRARSLMVLDASGTATALRIAGRAPERRGKMRLPDERAVTRCLSNGCTRERLDQAWLRAAHRAVAFDVPAPRRGQLRKREAWVGLDPGDPRTAVFVAPDAARLPDLVADVLAHCERAGPSPLPFAAIAFAQLVSCHPFDDGNGRVGRLLLATVLRRALGVEHTPPVGLVLGANRAAVGERLDAYRSGDVESWVNHVRGVAVMAAEAGERALTAT